MKKIMTCVLLFISINTWAQLPSWGMTENQYKMPNFETKMGEIGAQAYKNNWLLKITAPADWHNKIRMALSDGGERDVQASFNDSVHQSITITAAKGAKVAKISSSSGNNTTVQKQVVIDKPDIDTAVEAPDFGDTNFSSDNAELLENIAAMEIEVPNGSAAKPKPTKPAKSVAAGNTPKPTPAAAPKPVAEAAADDEVSADEIREIMRKRHARSKRVENYMPYSSIRDRDEMFIQGPVVLIKRFANQGVVIYFWMKEDYDPSIHQFVAMGSGKYKKSEAAVAESENTTNDQSIQTADVTVTPTELGFVAVDDVDEDKDELRMEYARNKRVDASASVNQLKADDVIYVKNQTVLVEREVTRGQSIYFWLVGDTTITREVKRRGDHSFLIL